MHNEKAVNHPHATGQSDGCVNPEGLPADSVKVRELDEIIIGRVRFASRAATGFDDLGTKPILHIRILSE